MSATGIRTGMACEEVTDLIGPPRRSLRRDLMFGGPSTKFVTISDEGGTTTMRSGMPQSFSSTFDWFYPGFPAGQDTIVAIAHGLVTEVISRSNEGFPLPTNEVSPWAAELMARHTERVGRDLPELLTQPTWPVLTGPEVRDHVLRQRPAGPEGGAISCMVRRFGKLDVLVSSFETADPAGIRAFLPDGYFSQLDRLLREYGIRPGSTDVAHWILCRDPSTEATAVHLAYIPREGVTALMPWDLLTPKEQEGGTRLGPD